MELAQNTNIMVTTVQWYVKLFRYITAWWSHSSVCTSYYHIICPEFLESKSELDLIKKFHRMELAGRVMVVIAVLLFPV